MPGTRCYTGRDAIENKRRADARMALTTETIGANGRPIIIVSSPGLDAGLRSLANLMRRRGNKRARRYQHQKRKQ